MKCINAQSGERKRNGEHESVEEGWSRTGSLILYTEGKREQRSPGNQRNKSEPEKSKGCVCLLTERDQYTHNSMHSFLLKSNCSGCSPGSGKGSAPEEGAATL